jgi:calcineurin-like phosphoesterase family protein
VQFATIIRYGKQRFYLSHYPTNTANPGEDFLSLATVNIYGHTHQDWTWCSDQPFSYCVCPEAIGSCPIEIKEIIEDLKENLAMKAHGLI